MGLSLGSIIVREGLLGPECLLNLVTHCHSLRHNSKKGFASAISNVIKNLIEVFPSTSYER